MLTSISPTCSSASIRAAVPELLDRKTADIRDHRLMEILPDPGQFLGDDRLDAGFCRPTALSIPPSHSAIRGVGLPNRGWRVVPLKEKEPRSPDRTALQTPPRIQRPAGRDDRVIQPEAGEIDLRSTIPLPPFSVPARPCRSALPVLGPAAAPHAGAKAAAHPLLKAQLSAAAAGF